MHGALAVGADILRKNKPPVSQASFLVTSWTFQDGVCHIYTIKVYTKYNYLLQFIKCIYFDGTLRSSDPSLFSSSQSIPKRKCPEGKGDCISRKIGSNAGIFTFRKVFNMQSESALLKLKSIFCVPWILTFFLSFFVYLKIAIIYLTLGKIMNPHPTPSQSVLRGFLVSLSWISLLSAFWEPFPCCLNPFYSMILGQNVQCLRYNVERYYISVNLRFFICFSYLCCLWLTTIPKIFSYVQLRGQISPILVLDI